MTAGGDGKVFISCGVTGGMTVPGQSGDPEGVRGRAADKVRDTARAAAREVHPTEIAYDFVTNAAYERK